MVPIPFLRTFQKRHFLDPDLRSFTSHVNQKVFSSLRNTY
jgi:hypothetical protein